MKCGDGDDGDTAMMMVTEYGGAGDHYCYYAVLLLSMFCP